MKLPLMASTTFGRLYHVTNVELPSGTSKSDRDESGTGNQVTSILAYSSFLIPSIPLPKLSIDALPSAFVRNYRNATPASVIANSLAFPNVIRKYSLVLKRRMASKAVFAWQKRLSADSNRFSQLKSTSWHVLHPNQAFGTRTKQWPNLSIRASIPKYPPKYAHSKGKPNRCFTRILRVKALEECFTRFARVGERP